ncbi:unnamed protein product [Wickerhamomyces anomalus]
MHSLTSLEIKVLVVPLRVVPRLKDLTEEESIDYMMTLQRVHKFIEHIYNADSLNIAIQDGPEAGQSVPHLHAHLIPRHRVNNMGDKIYEALNDPANDIEENYIEFNKRKYHQREFNDFVVKPDSDRFPRTDEEMQKEAQWLSQELKAYFKEK